MITKLLFNTTLLFFINIINLRLKLMGADVLIENILIERIL